MEIFFAPDFWPALAAIVAINLVLSGDNAIVIAFAAHALPRELQRRAIIWGAVGAVAVRVCLTVVVLWLLQLPGLRFAGGVLLVWIAYQLLASEPGAGGHQVAAPTGFWAAMRTIVIADAVMGLDNVLGVAAAADGKVALVVLGLVISIPIVISGSTLILKCIARFPSLLYAGGAILAWTAAKMLTEEPFMEDLLAGRTISSAALYAAVVGGVLGLAWVRKRQTASGSPA